MGAEDTAFGAILEIPQDALDKIKKADADIKTLAQTSQKAANEIKKHWQTIAVEGMDAFIAKINAANTALSGIKMPTGATFDLNVKSSDANAISNISSEVSKLANNLHTLSDMTWSWQKAMSSSSAVVADYAAKMRDLAKAIEESKTAEAMTKENASLKLAKSEYKEIVEAIDKAMAAQRKFIELYNNPSTSTDTKNRLAVQYQEAQASIEALNKRRIELENQHGDKLKAVAAQNAKKQADAEMAEHKKAEREKTKATEDAEKRRSAAVIRAARERAAQETVLNRQATRQRADDAAANKERRLADAYNQVAEAIKRTRAEIDALDKTDKNYQQEVTRLNAQLNEQLRILNRLSSGSRTLRDEHEKTRRVISKLRDVAFAYFSVSAITGYIKKMVEVRAQFEMQQVALRAILQNKDEADRIFMQVQQMALQSPFSILQLTTYTKQLAAYRIEANKLVGTTKMLADVSAGLGVDIQRLILAYGQVKSANYLRATEIRQFTEAGINIAGELSNYFSELQGRMVSVGEVMDMVTKRMVRFEDVEEVFKRVTSAGGLFYDMQRKQSETIAGQMQRIGDAYSIMLNEIGIANQNTIVAVLDGIRNLIGSWREMLPLIKSVGAALVAGFGIKYLITFGVQLKNIVTQMAALRAAAVSGAISLKAMSAASIASGIGAIAAAVALLGTAIYECVTHTTKLRDEFERMQGESLSDMLHSVSRFGELADIIRDNTLSVQQHNEALEEMKRTYNGILPAEQLEIENIRAMKDGYEDATAAIRAYYAEQLNKKAQEARNQAILDEVNEVSKTLRGATAEFIEQNAFLKGVDEAAIRADIGKIMNTIGAEIIAGNIKAENAMEEFAKRFTKFYGAEAKDLVMPETTEWVSVGWDLGAAVATGISGAFTGNSSAFKKAMKTLQDDVTASVANPLGMLISRADRDTEYAFDRLRYGMEGVVNEWGDIEAAMDDAQSHEERMMRQGAQGWIDYYKVLHDAANKYFENLRALYAMLTKGELYTPEGEFTEQGAKLKDETITALNNLNAISNSFGLAQLSAENITNALTNQRSLEREIADTSQSILGAYLELPKAQKNATDAQWQFYNPLNKSNHTLDEMIAKQNELAQGGVQFKGIGKNTYAEAWGQRAKESLGQATQVQRDVWALMDAIESKAGGAMVAFDRFSVTAQAGLSDVRAEAKKLYEQQENLIKEYDAAYAAAEQIGENAPAQAQKATGLSEEDYKTMKEQLPLVKLFAQALGAIFKAKKEGGRGTDPWQKRVSLIREMNTEYEKLLKYYDEGLAKQKIQESYAQAVAESFKGIVVDGKELSDINLWEGFDKKGMIKELQNILDSGLTLKDNKRAELQKMLAGLKAEVDIELEVKRKDEMQKKIDELFADYNLGEEFAKLGLPKELTAMFGRDTYKNLEAVKSELEKIKSIYTKDGGWGQIDEDAYQAALKKLNQIDRKNQEERAKNYYKYLLESYSKGAQIQLKAQQEVNKIMASEQYDDWTKRTAMQNIQLKAQADQQKLALQQFQSSDLYVDVFADLKSASEESLQYVINKLREFKDSFADMPADQVRAIIKQIEAAETTLSEKNLFGDFSKNVKGMIAYFKTRKQLETQLRNETTKQAKLRENIDKKNIELGKATTTLKTLKEGTKEYEDQESIIRGLQDEVNSLNGLLKESEERAAGFAKSLTSGQQATNNVRGALKGARDAMGTATAAIGGVFDGLDSMGLVSDGMRDVFDSLQGVMAGLDTTIAGIESIDVTKPMTIITGLAQAIGGVFQTIGGFFGMTDKKKERQINRLRDKVEDLDRAYQKLENTMERVYAFEDYVYGSKQLERNLRQQLNSYEQMLELEKSKKKSDTATIREFEDAIEDLKTQLQDLADERTQALGGIGKNEWAEAAEDFMDVWFDAFKEQGDGLDVLNDKWDEYLKNLIVKQATMRIVSKRLSGLFDMVDRAVSATSDQGEKLTRAELDALNQKRLEIMAALNGELKDLMEAWGIAGGQGELLLSDLQKGITNITEAQAAAIEAYLNSIRFAVYEHTNQLNQMLELLRAQYGASADSPILAEIRNIKSILTTISNNLSSVIKYDNGNYKVRVG